MSATTKFSAPGCGATSPDAIGCRNVLAHHYFGIDYEVVWAVVVHDLPVLKSNVQAA